MTPPGAGGCGDYATNVALQLARPAGQPALRVADVLRGHLLNLDGIRDVSVTGPGFLNISLRAGDAGAQRLVEEILRRGQRYGHADPGAPSRAVELRCRREPRALVHADVVARLLRAVHGDTVRIRCVGVSAGAGSGAGAGVSHAGPPPPPASVSAWADLLALPADISLTAADAPADVHFSADTPADTRS
ncbi:hypothetical protein [Streptomyces sp. e14]|uniref:hypothetical protein n=1 Tax=Streptomyces sp. e14 TaxID=645465 RepID=UPI003FCEB047